MPGARVLPHPNLLSIEQLVLVIDALEVRVARLEGDFAQVHSRTKRGNGRKTGPQEIENRRKWVAAMDAFIAGDAGALKRFTESGGWTPPGEYR